MRWAQLLRPLRGGPGWLQGKPTVLVSKCTKFTWDVRTYSSEKNRHSGQNCKNEEHRNDLGTALGICSEDVVDLLQLSISQRLLVFRQWRIGVRLDVQIEDMVAKCLGGAE